MLDRVLNHCVDSSNARGAWGKGVAEEFKRRFPSAYVEYHDWCNPREVDQETLRNWQQTLLGDAKLTTVSHESDPRKIKEGDHWHIATLIVSESWGRGRSEKAPMLRYTGNALEDLNHQLSGRGLNNAPVFAVRLNSGLFGVPWEETRAVLRAGPLNMTILTPEDLLESSEPATQAPTVEHALPGFAAAPRPSPNAFAPKPSPFAPGPWLSPFASRPKPSPFASRPTPSPFAPAPTRSPFAPARTPSPPTADPVALHLSSLFAASTPKAPKDPQSLKLQPVNYDEWKARLDETSRAFASQRQQWQGAPPPRQPFRRKRAGSESIADSTEGSRPGPSKRQKKTVEQMYEELEEAAEDPLALMEPDEDDEGDDEMDEEDEGDEEDEEGEEYYDDEDDYDEEDYEEEDEY
ncbi:MAG: hypothetical protein Q9191_007156 [Dirinaria sp. TL-2023a]